MPEQEKPGCEPPLARYCGGADFGIWDSNMDVYWICTLNEGDPAKAKNIVDTINGLHPPQEPENDG